VFLRHCALNACRRLLRVYDQLILSEQEEAKSRRAGAGAGGISDSGSELGESDGGGVSGDSGPGIGSDVDSADERPSVPRHAVGVGGSGGGSGTTIGGKRPRPAIVIERCSIASFLPQHPPCPQRARTH
jgi:hypothetical protein